jgi:hypothetical protein
MESPDFFGDIQFFVPDKNRRQTTVANNHTEVALFLTERIKAMCDENPAIKTTYKAMSSKIAEKERNTADRDTTNCESCGFPGHYSKNCTRVGGHNFFDKFLPPGDSSYASQNHAVLPSTPLVISETVLEENEESEHPRTERHRVALINTA